jgi:hypothetical protein
MSITVLSLRVLPLKFLGVTCPQVTQGGIQTVAGTRRRVPRKTKPSLRVPPLKDVAISIPSPLRVEGWSGIQRGFTPAGIRGEGWG